MPLPITALHGLTAGAFLQLVGDPAMRVSFSQLGEDIAIFHLLTSRLPPVTAGFYVDVGAFHPRLYSNTKMLHMGGWHGINIDPSDAAIARFREERPTDINLRMGVAPQAGELLYYKFANAEASTFSAETAEAWQRDAGWQLLGTELVPVRPLNDILAEHLPAGRAIDYLNIDVEGMDRAVVAGLDLARYRPKLLSVELHGADLLALRDDATIAHLVRHGYELAAVTVATCILIDGAATRGAS